MQVSFWSCVQLKNHVKFKRPISFDVSKKAISIYFLELKGLSVQQLNMNGISFNACNQFLAPQEWNLNTTSKQTPNHEWLPPNIQMVLLCIKRTDRDMHKGRQKSHQLPNYLNKTNLLGVAAEALPTAHESILPDQPMRIAADSAVI